MSAEHDKILQLLVLGKYQLTLHARMRMVERNITHADIQSCGRTGKAIDSDGKVKVTGSDCDNESMSIVCVNEDGVIIVTVF